MWPGGQVWKPGPAYPATAAALPPRGRFVCGSFVAGVADPGAARSVKKKLIQPWRRAPHRTFLRTSFWQRCRQARHPVIQRPILNRVGAYIPLGVAYSILPQRLPRSKSHTLKGYLIPAQGANPGNRPGKRDPRSEGTPHRSPHRTSCLRVRIRRIRITGFATERTNPCSNGESIC
jgi:hypothetical protein